MENIKELESLLRARYDLLYVVTHEEERVANDINTIADALDLAVCVWTFTSGVKMIRGAINATVDTVSNGKKLSQSAKVEDGAFMGQPTRILSIARDCKSSCVFILNDYHSYFKDAEVVRELKDTLCKVKPTYTPIVVVSSVLKIPTEIEKVTTVVDYALPTTEEIRSLIEKVIQGISTKAKSVTVVDKTKEEIVSACQGLTIKEIEDVTMRSLIENGTLDARSVMHQKKQIIKKSGILEYYEVDEGMTDVGGMDILKDWLRKRRGAFTDKARAFGLPAPKGLLLLGIPGCGKVLDF